MTSPSPLHNAHWSVETDRDEPGTVSIGITTFNRPDFCVDQLVKLAQQPAVLEILDEVIVVDQGNQKVRDHTLFEQASKALGSKLRYIEQGNLGGSGGFSRSMDEATVKGSADYVLLLDDDVVCEPEGILRAVTFADLTKQPMLVGGQMFSLYDRTVMHAYGETVARWRWFWGPAPKTKHGHNFAQRSLRSTKWLHRRVDVDYNGWWMCLIPTDVIRQVGLSLPMFIKWDDAEFGLRAAEAGFQTATLPGVAVWHVPWHEKDDTIDWQAYFHRRNRIVAALLHTPYERGGRLVQESFETQVKHVLSMQYAPAEMGLMAIEDILDGPERMHRDLRMRLGELNALRKQYDDSIAKADLDQFPTARRKKPPRRGKGPGTPVGLVARAKTMALSGIRQALPVRELSQSHPEANVPHVDLKWWLLAQYDSALVSSADGTSASWYKRDPKKARDLMSRSVALHVRLAKEWPELAQTYKDALPELASPKTWAATFEDSLDGRSQREARDGSISHDLDWPSLPPDTVAALRDALTRADFTVDGVAALLGPHAHAALGRNETTPGLRRTADGSALATLVRLWTLQAPVARSAVDQALPGVVDQLVEGGVLERSGGEVRALVDVRPYADDESSLVGRVRPDPGPRRARAPDAGRPRARRLVGLDQPGPADDP